MVTQNATTVTGTLARVVLPSAPTALRKSELIKILFLCNTILIAVTASLIPHLILWVYTIITLKAFDDLLLSANKLKPLINVSIENLLVL